MVELDISKILDEYDIFLKFSSQGHYPVRGGDLSRKLFTKASMRDRLEPSSTSTVMLL